MAARRKSDDQARQPRVEPRRPDVSEVAVVKSQMTNSCKVGFPC